MNQVSKYMSEIGRKGGSSKSGSKLRAARENAAKATEARRKKYLEKKGKVELTTKAA